jgi:hypothetical protein
MFIKYPYGNGKTILTIWDSKQLRRDSEEIFFRFFGGGGGICSISRYHYLHIHPQEVSQYAHTY